MVTWSSAFMPSSSGVIVVVDVGDGLEDALAEVALLVAVAQLDRLVRAGAGPGGDRGGADGAVVEQDFDFEGGVAATVQDLAGVDVLDETHDSSVNRANRNVPRWVRSTAPTARVPGSNA